MNSIALSTMRDELLKIASDIKVHHDPVGTMRQTGFVGKYFSPARVAEEPVLQGISGGKKHVLALPAREDFTDLLKNRPDFVGDPEGLRTASDAAYKSSRKHELTHYLRGKKGKMDRYGKPGVRGVLTTGREEVAAHLQGLKPYKRSEKMMSQASQGVIPGVVGSVQSAYPQGIRKALLGGTLGKALGLGGRLLRRGGA